MAFSTFFSAMPEQTQVSRARRLSRAGNGAIGAAHHLRFTQPRAMARKVSDEFTVPLCATHHHELHMRGDEKSWWAERAINPSPIAEELWRASRIGDPGLAD
jgi:hypothetical protein